MPRRPSRKPRAPSRDLSVPETEIVYSADEGDVGKRLDRFLDERLPWRSRTTMVRFIEDGRVRVSGELVRRKAKPLRRGDVVVLAVPPPRVEVRHEELARELEILHEDEDLLAIAKPAGLIVHPVGKNRFNTLIQALHWRYRRDPAIRTAGRPPVIPKICHRLDKDTSGVLLVALNDRARARIQEIFEERTVEKEYLAVVSGTLEPEEGLIDRPIGPDPDGKLSTAMCVRPDGDRSRTRFRVLERLPGATAVRFDLETGRQHQIRVHAASLGHPVLLDPIYGPWELGARWPTEGDIIIARHALHARRIALPHPRTGDRLELVAPVPADLRGLIDGLRTLGRPAVPHPPGACEGPGGRPPTPAAGFPAYPADDPRPYPATP